MMRQETVVKNRCQGDKWFKVNNAVAEIGPYSSRVGQIVNIGMDGLEFCYLDNGQHASESGSLNIWGDRHFNLKKIPFKTVKEDALTTTDRQCIKRRQVKFGRLDSLQRTKLKYFIRNHTDGSEPSFN